jgi:hypothetical protein
MFTIFFISSLLVIRNPPVYRTARLHMWILWRPDPAVHLLLDHGDALPETHLGSLDGPHRHPHAGVSGGILEAAMYAPGGEFSEGAGEGGGGS